MESRERAGFGLVERIRTYASRAKRNPGTAINCGNLCSFAAIACEEGRGGGKLEFSRPGKHANCAGRKWYDECELDLGLN